MNMWGDHFTYLFIEIEKSTCLCETMAIFMVYLRHLGAMNRRSGACMQEFGIILLWMFVVGKTTELRGKSMVVESGMLLLKV
jgi:hypothetical protein